MKKTVLRGPLCSHCTTASPGAPLLRSPVPGLALAMTAVMVLVAKGDHGAAVAARAAWSAAQLVVAVVAARVLHRSASQDTALLAGAAGHALATMARVVLVAEVDGIAIVAAGAASVTTQLVVAVVAASVLVRGALERATIALLGLAVALPAIMVLIAQRGHETVVAAGAARSAAQRVEPIVAASVLLRRAGQPTALLAVVLGHALAFPARVVLVAEGDHAARVAAAAASVAAQLVVAVVTARVLVRGALEVPALESRPALRPPAGRLH